MRYFKINDLLIHLPAHGEVAKTPVAGICTAVTNTTVVTTTAPGMPTGCGGASPPHTTNYCQVCTPQWTHHGNSVGCGGLTATMSMADRDILKKALDEIHTNALKDEADRTVQMTDATFDTLSTDEKEKLTTAVRALSEKLGLGKASSEKP